MRICLCTEPPQSNEKRKKNNKIQAEKTHNVLWSNKLNKVYRQQKYFLPFFCFQVNISS